MATRSPSSVASHRSRRPRAAAAVAGVVLLASASAGCLPADANTFLQRTNALRTSHGVAPLADQDVLTKKAEEWARHLADTGTLAHSELSASLDGLPWFALGENVGVSTPTDDTLRTLQDQLASSAQHRANLLNGQFDHMGVGVAESADGRVWVVEVLADL